MSTEDIRINYKVSGQGQDVVLLHGWGCDLQIWIKVHSLLETNFKVWSIDLPGFGQSSEPSAVWGSEDYTNKLHSFFEEMGIMNPILLGHSFGGKLSILLSQKTNPTAMILIGSTGIKPQRTLKYYWKVYTYKLMKKVLLLPPLKIWGQQIIDNYRSKVGSDDYKKASENMKKILVRVVQEDFRYLLSKIKCPVLLIWGEKDSATPLKNAKLMEKLIPDAGLIVFEKSGHYCFLEQFNKFALILDSFLKNYIKKS